MESTLRDSKKAQRTGRKEDLAAMIVQHIHNSATMPIIAAIDTVGYKKKPANREIGAIRNRLSGSGAHIETNIYSLAKYMEQGVTVQGALLRDKLEANEDTDSRFIQQQLFCIDIDNTGERQLTTPEAIQSVCNAAGITPAIIAESFSSSEKLRKYHAFFISDKPVKDAETARSVILHLQDIFEGAADPACKDPARIVYGTAPDKQVIISGGYTPIEALTAPEPKQQRQESTPAPAPQSKAKHNNSEYQQAEPVVLLGMIDVNALSYEEYLSVLCSFKAAGGSLEDFLAWDSAYNGKKRDFLRADAKMWKSAHGKKHTVAGLKHFAALHSPATYAAYIAELSPAPDDLRAAKPKKAKQESSGEAAAVTAPEQVEEWQPIKQFEKKVELQAFPLDSLPKALKDYVEAVAAYNSVYNEMCVLPMFAALSLALQGKARVIHPGTGYSEPLNLYCLVIANPGERKSSTLNMFMQPIKDYERRYNEIHRNEIETYCVKHRILSQRLSNAIQRAKKAEDEQTAINLRQELTELEKDPKAALNYTLQDVTPEALISALSENNERAAIIGDEATLFKILCGAYSSGKGSNNVNFDVLLNSYDGNTYKVSRKGSGNIYLKSPLVTIGTMIQPQPFKQVLENADLSGKGLLQRFIFAVPQSNVGNIPFYAPKVPEKVAAAYNSLICELLRKNDSTAALTFDREAVRLLEDYHALLQKKLSPDGMFAGLEEFASKQFAKVLRIAALLHLCEHSENEQITGHTAMNAISIGLWIENQAAAALEADMITDTEKNAKYVLRKLQKSSESVLTRRDIQRRCKRLNIDDLLEALSYLDDMNILKYQEEKTKGRPTIKVTLNPDIKNVKL